MFVVLLVSVLMAVAPSVSTETQKIVKIDLFQNLCESVNSTFVELSDYTASVTDDLIRLAELKVQGNEIFTTGNAELLEETSKAIAERMEMVAEENAKHAEDMVNINADNTREALMGNADILKQILSTLDANQDSVSRQFTNTEVEMQVQCEDTFVFTSSSDTWEKLENCADYYASGYRQNGVYHIFPFGVDKGFKVYCDLETDNGGWTMFQRRGDFGNTREYFFRTWAFFNRGFGDLNGEFWLGNDRISAMTKAKNYELRIDIWDDEGEHRYAKYLPFRVEDRQQLYRLTIGGYVGTAGDSMSASDNDQSFSTRNNDRSGKVGTYQGAWWFNPSSTSKANLNGLHLVGDQSSSEGIRWETWRKILARSEMKIRPETFRYR